MRPVDLEHLVTVGAPTVPPSGDRVVAAVGHPDLAADASVAQLWEFPLDPADGEPRRLTRGRSDRAPRFSPDGRMLGFLRAVDGAPQLHLMDARGGEPLAVTDRTLGVEAFVFSPDSQRIAFASREPEPGRYGSVEKLEADAEPPRRITSLVWHENGLGWSGDRRLHQFLLEVPDLGAEPVYDPAPTPDGPGEKPARVPAARRLTHGDSDHWAAFFSPSGDELWVVARLHDGADRDLRTDLHRIPLAPGVDADEPRDPERMTADAPARDIVAGGFAADGTLWTIASELGETGRDFVGRQYAAYRGATAAELVAVTDADAIDLAPASSPLAVDGRGRLLASAPERGREVLVAVDADGEIERLTAESEITGAAVALADEAPGGDTIVAVASTADSSGVLLRIGGEPIADLGGALRDSGLIRPIEEEHPSRDGYPVHGWVTVPEVPGPHPVLLMIHGGPLAQYTVGVFDETQVLASAGYAVVQCNPRGSLGYGFAHGRSIKERMGTLDLDDVLAFLDGAIAAHPELDGARTGILGGSYGGYLTAWTIAHDHRFSAAVVERGYLDPEAFIGTSDIGSFFSDEYTGADPAHRASQSPQAVVDRVRTPTLVIHSEDDLRCPLPQATRYYTALKRHGVEAELLVFPGEDHELSRSGRPRHRVQRFDAILEWFGRYLPVESAATPAGEGGH